MTRACSGSAVKQRAIREARSAARSRAAQFTGLKCCAGQSTPTGYPMIRGCDVVAGEGGLCFAHAAAYAVFGAVVLQHVPLWHDEWEAARAAARALTAPRSTRTIAPMPES